MKRRYAWGAAYTALPESIWRRKALNVEGLGPLQDGLGAGFILMNSGLSTVLIQAECRRTERAPLRDARGRSTG